MMDAVALERFLQRAAMARHEFGRRRAVVKGGDGCGREGVIPDLTIDV